MKANERRKAIATYLHSVSEPIPGGALSARFGVSRQIIVGDIAALKEGGYKIAATHRGYILEGSPLCERVFKVLHTTEQTGDELKRIVALGATVADVTINHKVYGRITAALNIDTEKQVDDFIEGVRSGKSTELMQVTGGYHYHTVRAVTEEILDAVEASLKDGGYLAPVK